eukprot:SAG31_NODE_6023_length_2205_cov_1.671890_2_plen_306_part_01
MSNADYEECAVYLARLRAARPDWSINDTIAPYGTAPLHCAAANPGAHKIVALLLEAGANPNVRADNGDMPLHLTTNKKSAELLLTHGADPSMINRSGTTIGWRLAQVFRLAKRVEQSKRSTGELEDAVEVDSKPSISDADMALKISQYKDMQPDDLDFEELAHVGSIETLVVLLNVPNLAARASHQLNTVLTTATIEPEDSEKLKTLAQDAATGLMRFLKNDGLEIFRRAETIMAAASNPEIRHWFWHIGLIDACVKIVKNETLVQKLPEAHPAAADFRKFAMTAEAMTDVLSELLALENSDFVGG